MPLGTRAIMKKFILIYNLILQHYTLLIVIVYQSNMNKV